MKAMGSARLGRLLGEGLASLLTREVATALTRRLVERRPEVVLEGFGPLLNRKRDLDSMPFDLALSGPLQFEHLAGLFASTSLDHAVIAMTVRQAAYLFGLIRQMRARRVIEIGRYKGGSTLVIAAAMSAGYEAQLWSLDIGDKEARLRKEPGSRSYDQQLADVCARFGLQARLIVGDSRVVELDTGAVDLVLIDGDHSYEGVKSDFERFGRRVRVGGAVLFDDAFDEHLFRTHSDTVGRLVEEIQGEGSFRLAKVVDRLAHLERFR